jgi:hypothetical protein
MKTDKLIYVFLRDVSDMTALAGILDIANKFDLDPISHSLTYDIDGEVGIYFKSPSPTISYDAAMEFGTLPNVESGTWAPENQDTHRLYYSFKTISLEELAKKMGEIFKQYCIRFSKIGN